MTVKRVLGVVFSVALMVGMAGCASVPTGQPAPFTPQPIAKAAYVQKADNLVFVLDSSSSMLEGYKNVEKFALARNMVANFNQTMPDLALQTVLRTLGHDPVVSLRSTMLAYGPTAYSRTGLAESLKKVSRAGGPSPMGSALTEVPNDLSAAKGKIAVVIVSDGKDMAAEAMPAAQALKAKYADRLCIYTVLVGDNPAGRDLMAKMASLTGCGKAISVDDVATGAGMADFVRTVLIEAEKDSDGDGVYDSVDRCDYTPKGTKVDQYGCPIAKKIELGKTYVFEGVQFESNKAELKPTAFPVLDKVADALNAEPDTKVHIKGYTDSTGKRDYNVDLSQRRAETVKKYLVSKGVAAERLTATGYGPDQPVASNDTKEGKAKNRRVEFVPTK